MTVHHSITKKATKLGVTLVEDAEGGFRLAHNETKALSVESWDSASEAVKDMASGNVTWEKFRPLASGVMAMSYHDRYESNSHGPGCNDTLDCELRDFLVTDSGLDVEELRTIGENAGVWKSDWERLNPGMQRMNCANRLRALLRNDANAEITIGTKTGRFGVAFRPARRGAKGKALKLAA